MEWIEICIDIVVIQVFGPIQGFDQGDSEWKSSNFPRDHNCPAGLAHCRRHGIHGQTSRRRRVGPP